MLIKWYNPRKNNSLNHDTQCQWCDKCVQRKYKNLAYNTTTLTIFDNMKSETVFQLFDEQKQAATQEAQLHLKYSYLTQWTYDKTIQQYNQFFFYENHAYNKEEIKQYIAKDQAYDTTFISKPLPAKKEITEEQFNTLQEQLQKNNQRWVSRQAIRNITWYTYTPIPSHSETKEPVYVEWQHKLLEDKNDLIIVNGSRQIGKSYTIAEKTIEESFIPNNDMLVWGFTTNTTNIIRNYVLKYIRKFPKDTFTHYKAERYIINNKTGTKIYFRTLSDDAQSILGMTLKLIIVDEAQLVDEFVFEEVLLPTLSTTWGKLIMILTPWRKRSWYAFKKIMEIKKWIIQDASLYDVDITQNPFVHPKKRADIMARQDEPWIRRQYFCEWNDWWDNLFNFQKTNILIIPSQDWFFVLWKDPARLHDRSGYCLIYVHNWKATIIVSWFVPNHYKKDWWLQAKFYKELIENYTNKNFKKWYNVIDVSWVWDWVAKIFQDQWIRFVWKIRYSAGSTETISWTDYRVSKSILINTTLDMIQEWLVDIFEPTNKDLLEEVSYINEAETRTWLIAMDTNFFDDITNATMIALYIVSKLWLLNRKIQESHQKSSWSRYIDAIENPSSYIQQREMSDVW